MMKKIKIEARSKAAAFYEAPAMDTAANADEEAFLLSMALQTLFHDHNTEYSFTTGADELKGIFAIKARYPTKVLVEKDRTIFLGWESSSYYLDQQFYSQLQDMIDEDAFGLDDLYHVSLEESNNGMFFQVKLGEFIIHDGEQIFDYAVDAARHQLLFQLAVNKLAAAIEDLWSNHLEKKKGGGA